VRLSQAQRQEGRAAQNQQEYKYLNRVLFAHGLPLYYNRNSRIAEKIADC
jgi:hypothetical protein